MGFNFQAGHPLDVYEGDEGKRVEMLLKSTLGQSVALGTPGQCFRLPDELGWSWWKDLQVFACETFGASRCEQIGAVDAWAGVYLDADIKRILISPAGPPPSGVEKPPKVSAVMYGGSILSRIRHRIGFRTREERQADKLMLGMFEELGPRAGERRAIQVGCLPALKLELDALLESIGVAPEHDAVEMLRRGYADDDTRVDDDSHIQCLCHAWLTAEYAIENWTPLWLIK